MDDRATARAQEYVQVYEELLAAAARLDALRPLDAGGVDPHATAAMHAVRFRRHHPVAGSPEHPAAGLPP